MDSKRRHELSQNALANWLTAQYEEWIQPNSQWIGWAAVGVVAVAVGLYGVAKMNEWNKAAAWRDYYTALQSPDMEASLETLAERSQPDMAARARLTMGQIHLAEAADLCLTDRIKGLEKVDKAIHQFQRVRESGKDDAIKKRATWGLGQAYETAAAMRAGQGDLDEAVKEYKTLAERWPDDFLGRQATRQLDLLTRADTKRFLVLAATKTIEAPKPEDFKVEIDPKAPFSGGPADFDPQKALEGGGSILGGAFSETVEEPKKEEPKKEEPKKEEPKSEEPKSEPDAQR